jgi:hypothetical protein
MTYTSRLPCLACQLYWQRLSRCWRIVTKRVWRRAIHVAVCAWRLAGLISIAPSYNTCHRQALKIGTSSSGCYSTYFIHILPSQMQFTSPASLSLHVSVLHGHHQVEIYVVETLPFYVKIIYCVWTRCWVLIKIYCGTSAEIKIVKAPETSVVRERLRKHTSC